MKQQVSAYAAEIEQMKYESMKCDLLKQRFDTTNDVIGGLLTMLPIIVGGVANTLVVPNDEKNPGRRVAELSVSLLLALYKLKPNLDSPKIQAMIVPAYDMTNSECVKYITDRETSIDPDTESVIFGGKLTPIISSNDDVNVILDRHAYEVNGKAGYLQTLAADPDVLIDPDGILYRSVENLYQIVAYEAEYAVVPKYNRELCNTLGIDWSTLEDILTRCAIKVVSEKLTTTTTVQ